MTGIIAWIIVLGLAIAITGIYLLSKQIENHSRDMTRILHQSNEMILAQLERLSGSPAAVSKTVGMILERRSLQRRSPMEPMTEDRGRPERRKTPGRRLTDHPNTRLASNSV